MSDIATVLGTSQDLARAEKKRWAKYQPFKTNGNPYKKQTDADRKDAAWGFYFDSDDPNAPCDRSATELINKIINGDIDWARKDIDVSRMGDFDGYNHAAVVPYSAECTSSSGNHIKDVVIRQSTSPNAEMLLQIMPEVDSVLVEDYEVYGIYRMEGENTSEIISTGSKVYQLDEYKDAWVQVEVRPTTKYQDLHYEFIWAATNRYEPDVTESKWIYFPNSKVFFTMSGYFDIVYDEYESPIFEAIDVNGRILSSASAEVKQINRIALYASHNLAFEPKCKIVLHFWKRDGLWDSGIDHVVDYSLAPDGGFLIENINLQSITANLRADNTMMAMSVYINDSNKPIVGGENFATYHFDFTTNRMELGVAEEKDGISIWDMQTQYGN